MEKFKVGDTVYSPLWKGKGIVTLVFDNQNLEIKTKDTSFQIIDVYGKVLGEGEVVIFKNPVKVVEKEGPYATFESVVIDHIAVDPSGGVFGYHNVPFCTSFGWDSTSGFCTYLGELKKPSENWRESLKKLETPIKFGLNFE